MAMASFTLLVDLTVSGRGEGGVEFPFVTLSQLHAGNEGIDIMSMWTPDLQLPSINIQERPRKPMVVPDSSGKIHGPKTIKSFIFP